MILAADPGLSGALALYDGTELQVIDMPTMLRSVAGKDRRVIDERGVLDHMELAALLGATVCLIEQVNGMPGQSGPAAFTFGYGAGVLATAAMAYRIPVERVPPARWKAAMQCPSDKTLARARASEVLPSYAHLWTRKKDDGRSEAGLLAVYGWLTRGGAP